MNTIADGMPPDDALDSTGRCWWGGPMGGGNEPSWILSDVPGVDDTHWLPHDAIPVPIVPDHDPDAVDDLLTAADRNPSLCAAA